MTFRVKDGGIVGLEGSLRQAICPMGTLMIEHRLGFWRRQGPACLCNGRRGSSRRCLLIPTCISTTEWCHWSREEEIANRSRATTAATTAPTRLCSLHAHCSSRRGGVVLICRARFCPDVAIITSKGRVYDGIADRCGSGTSIIHCFCSCLTLVLDFGVIIFMQGRYI